jgi:hypothetical protein
MNFSDRLKVAQNIIARGGIGGVDLYSELAKSEALMNGIGAEMAMRPPTPQEMPLEQPNSSVGAPIMPQAGESTTPTEITPPMP